MTFSGFDSKERGQTYGTGRTGYYDMENGNETDCGVAACS